MKLVQKLLGTEKTPEKETKRPRALHISAKSLLRANHELKASTVLEASDTVDIIPEGIITGKFEIERSQDSKKWMFNILAKSHVTLASSKSYSSISTLMAGIADVIENASRARLEDQTVGKREILPFPKWIIYHDAGGKYNFILYAKNGNPVAHSRGYITKLHCKHDIDNVIRVCKNPIIEKTYLHHH